MPRITLTWDRKELSEDESYELLYARKNWFEELGYEAWQFTDQRLAPGYYLDHYDIEDEQVAMLFKLTFGGQ